jgi:hypothetical protein
MAETFLRSWRRELREWVLRDWLAGLGLFLATAGFVLWQNAHIAVLWDLSYLLDTSWRIALGQIPYRDFPLVHPPGTFLMQAGWMRLLGRSAWIPIGYAAVVGGAATVLAWRILLRVLQRRVQGAWVAATALALPLCFLGVYGVYPHPIYDCDCAFAVLVAVYLLQRLAGCIDRGDGHVRLPGLAAGAAAVAPCFFKQNIGLPFLLVLVAGVVLLLLPDRWHASGNAVRQEALLWLLAGLVATSTAAILLIQLTAGWANFWHWTVRFAGERRLPGLGPMLTNFRQPQLLWTLPALLIGRAVLQRHPRAWLRVAGAGLIAAPFFACILQFFVADGLDDQADVLLALWPLLLVAAAVNALYELWKRPSLRSLIPLVLLAAIHGTLLSQQLWGSTYAIWPLLLILVAELVGSLPVAADWTVPALSGIIGATLLICGGLYAAGHDRLSYLNEVDGPVVHATLPALRGMSAPGPYLGNFEELVRFSDTGIPREDGILLLPGEEPFFYATGRMPRFPVQIFDRTTDPYSADELVAEARRRGIRWVIVKTRLQSDENPLPERKRTITLIEMEFIKAGELSGYQIYQRQ